MQAFRSTLEQAAEADIILNVCDASSPEARVHLDVTETLLAELGCGDRPVIPVMNKCDLVPALMDMPAAGNVVRISALHGKGIDSLLAAIEEALPVKMQVAELLLPFEQAGLAARIRREREILEEEYVPEGLRLRASIPPELLSLIAPYRTDSQAEEGVGAGAETEPEE